MRDYHVTVRAQALLARKAVKRGDVILTSKPFCTLLDTNFVGSYCDHCFASCRYTGGAEFGRWCWEGGR